MVSTADAQHRAVKMEDISLKCLGRLRLHQHGYINMNEVNARRARLQLGLVTVFERVYHLGL